MVGARFRRRHLASTLRMCQKWESTWTMGAFVTVWEEEAGYRGCSLDKMWWLLGCDTQGGSRRNEDLSVLACATGLITPSAR